MGCNVQGTISVERPHGPSTVDEAKVEIALSEDVMPLKETDVTVSADHGAIVSMVQGIGPARNATIRTSLSVRSATGARRPEAGTRHSRGDVTPEARDLRIVVRGIGDQLAHMGQDHPTTADGCVNVANRTTDAVEPARNAGSPKAGKVATGADTVMTAGHEAVADGR